MESMAGATGSIPSMAIVNYRYLGEFLMKEDDLDVILDLFLVSIKATSQEHNIELMEDAIANAKSAFLRNCISSGIPSKATAKEAGKRFVLKMMGF
jgi:hypothetical protein